MSAVIRWRYPIAVGLAALAVLLHLVMDAVLADRAPFLFHLPALIAAAIYLGRGPAALVAGVALATSLVTFGPGPWPALDTVNLPPAVAFIVVALTVGALCADLRRSRRAVAEAQANLHLVQEDTGAGLWEIDLTHWSIISSPGMWRLLGETPRSDAVSVEDVLRRIHPDDLQLDRRVIQEQIRSHGSACERENRIVLPGGQVRWVYSKMHIQRDAAGRALRIRGASLDITERKRAQLALEASEARFRVAQESSALAFTLLKAVRNRQGRIVDFEWSYANPAAGRILGHTPEDLVGQRLLALLPGNRTPGSVFDWYVGVVTSGTALDREFAYDADGIHGWFHLMATRYEDGVAVWFTDITARKQAEQLAQQSRRQLETITGLMPAGVVQCSRDLRYLWVSQTFAEARGLPVEAIIGRPIREILGESVFEYLQPKFQRVLSGETVEYEAELDTPHRGKRWFHATYVPTRGADGRPEGWVGVISDVSAHKRLEAQLQLSDRRKDEFLATLAHELRNPLAPIRYAARLAHSSRATPAQVEWGLEVIERQASQMGGLLDDLLDVTRIGSGHIALHRQRISVQSAITAAVETCHPLIEARKHRLELDIPAAGPWVDADPLRLAQVFSNLLTNAAKYTDPGGHIRVQVRSEGDSVVIRVRDTGIGLRRDMLPRLFQMYMQDRTAIGKSAGGLGVGLALVRGLVQLHGGTVEAHSDGPGTGSEFLVRLPRAVAPALLPAAPPAGAAEGTDTRVRVLVADDNPDAAGTLAMFLRLAGHEVVTASDGEETLRLAQSFRPDVALLDIGMPKLDGYQVAACLRDEPWAARLTLVAITGWGQQGDKERAAEAGFAVHLTKPVDPDRLEAVLAQVHRAPRAPLSVVTAFRRGLRP